MDNVGARPARRRSFSIFTSARSLSEQPSPKRLFHNPECLMASAGVVYLTASIYHQPQTKSKSENFMRSNKEPPRAWFGKRIAMIPIVKSILLAIGLLVVSSILSQAQDWPLRFDAEPAWKIQYRGDGIDFFELSRRQGENVFFIFSKWPAPGGKDQIPHLVKQIADGLQDDWNRNQAFASFYDEYRWDEITGEPFSGQAAVFRDKLGMVLVVFMISDGDGIWNGQFSGSEAMWANAKTILKRLQRANK